MIAGELWGALSVADHVHPRALVAEVLLFDRLVIPAPPDADAEEEQRWVRNGWKPARQRTLLSVLGYSGRKDDLAVTAPWTPGLRDRFDAMYRKFRDAPAARSEERARLIADLKFDCGQLRPDAQMMTRMILTANDYNRAEQYDNQLPRTWVESVVPAYSSYKAANQELAMDVTVPTPAKSLANVLGWRLVVPADGTWSDEKALERAAKLARSDDYRLARESFRDWWRSRMQSGMPPETAVKDLAERADHLNDIAKRNERRTRTMRAFALFGGVTSAATFWFPPVAVPSGLIAVASVGADALMKPVSAPAALAPAVMFHDARKQMGWY